jgi:TonB family protein
MVTDLMRRLQASTLSLLLWALVFVPGSAPAAFAQQVNPENRKIVNRVTPQYPEIARGMNLSGSVKADVLVAPNGTAKLVEVKGGHPILVRAAQDAIYKWKWVPAAHETREAIEVRFDPR